MPLTAIDKATENRIFIRDYDDPRGKLKSGDLKCPFCDSDLFIAQGYIIRPYFFHRNSCETELIHHPESQEHFAGKELVRNWLKERKDYINCKINLEYIIPEAGRIADIMVLFSNGWKEAHEIQLASITVQEIDERTRSYNLQGIEVVWWLGEKSCGEDSKTWFLNTYGYLLELYIEAKEFNKRGSLV